MSSATMNASFAYIDAAAQHVRMANRSADLPKGDRLPEPATPMGARIVERLRALNLSCNELDRRIGQTSGYTSPLIRGKKPGAQHAILGKMATELGVTLDWLLYGDRSGGRAEVGAMGTLIDTGVRYSAVKYPNLEIAVAFFKGRKTWEPWVLAMARAGYWAEDCEPPDWEKRLDSMQAVLTHHRHVATDEATSR